MARRGARLEFVSLGRLAGPSPHAEMGPLVDGPLGDRGVHALGGRGARLRHGWLRARSGELAAHVPACPTASRATPPSTGCSKGWTRRTTQLRSGRSHPRDRPQGLRACLKTADSQRSGQSPDLDAYQGEEDESLGAGSGGLVVADEAAVWRHEPAEGALDDPAASQNGEAAGLVGVFDDRDGELGPQSTDPGGENRAGVAAIDPQEPQPGGPRQHAGEQGLGASALRRAGRGDMDAEQQAQRVHQQVALAPFDLLGCVVADSPAVPVGFHALAVQDGRRGPRAFAGRAPHQGPEPGVERLPDVLPRPFAEDMVDRLPRRKLLGAAAATGTRLWPHTAAR